MFKKKYEIVEIWECEWDKLIKDNSFVREFVKNQDIKAPIEARDALFGGRTNAFKLFHTKKEDETIKYYDITSLYPFLQKYKRYPINHPKIISDNFQTIEHYFGLAKIRILPPKKLNIPILPMKINGKLIFTLCCKCAEENIKLCVHNDNERCLEGTWCTPEILKAIEYHYKIFKIYEVWHFENTDCFNKDTKSGGIFTEYIHTFLKMKQEASGFPLNVKSTEEQNIYIKEYFENEDILLESSNIVKNPGIRKVSKIMLNSLWGRFGMNTNKTKMILITEPSEFFRLISDKRYVIMSLNFPNEKVVQVFYNEIKKMHYGCNTNNIVLAAFVTCYARLELFKYLILLNERLLYCDTDSIIFISKNGFYEPKLGNFLGDFTDELEDDSIYEFLSLGPKNYGYVTVNGKQSCTVKGFTLNYIASLYINFNSMKQILHEDFNKKIFVPQCKIVRDKNNWELFTDYINKEYGFVYDKRILNKDFSTSIYCYDCRAKFMWKNLFSIKDFEQYSRIHFSCSKENSLLFFRMAT